MSGPSRTSPSSAPAPRPEPAALSDRPPAAAAAPTTADLGLAEHEGQFHRYASNDIPWWVRAMWICYWIGALYYATRYLVPMVRAYF